MNDIPTRRASYIVKAPHTSLDEAGDIRVEYAYADKRGINVSFYLADGAHVLIDLLYEDDTLPQPPGASVHQLIDTPGDYSVLNPPVSDVGYHMQPTLADKGQRS